MEQVGPALEAGVDDPAVGNQPAQCRAQGQAPPGGQTGIMAAQRLDVGGEVEGDERGFLRHLADQGLAVLVGAQAGEGRARVDAGHPGRAVERPGHHHPIAGLTGVDSVAHLSVEVLEVFDHPDAEALEVEIGIAGDQRIEGPGHLRDPEVEAPQPLMQLHRRPGSAPDGLVPDSGDVRMHDRAQGLTEEADRHADHLIGFADPVGRRDIVARMGEGHDQPGFEHGRAGLVHTPHFVEEQ